MYFFPLFYDRSGSITHETDLDQYQNETDPKHCSMLLLRHYIAEDAASKGEVPRGGTLYKLPWFLPVFLMGRYLRYLINYPGSYLAS